MMPSTGSTDAWCRSPITLSSTPSPRPCPPPPPPPASSIIVAFAQAGRGSVLKTDGQQTDVPLSSGDERPLRDAAEDWNVLGFVLAEEREDRRNVGTRPNQRFDIGEVLCPGGSQLHEYKDLDADDWYRFRGTTHKLCHERWVAR